MSFLNPSPQAFGLDINDYSLKLVRLGRLGKKTTLKSYNVLPAPAGIISGGEIKDEAAFTALLQKLIKTRHGSGSLGHEVIAVLPETKTFLKSISLPRPETADTAAAIRAEAEKHLPYNLSEVYLDWQILNKTSDDQWEVLIGAAPQRVVDHYLAVLQAAGLSPLALEIEAVALTRALLAEEKIIPNQAGVIIDFGATRSGLVIYDKGVVQATISLPISGNQITETIVNTLKLSWPQAEKAKVVCGLDKNKCSGALKEILNTTFDDLAQKIQHSLAFYHDHFAQTNAVKEMILCGGSANFSDLDKVLTEKTKIPTRLGNPWINIVGSKQKSPLAPGPSLVYTTALGLALRGLRPENI